PPSCNRSAPAPSGRWPIPVTSDPAPPGCAADRRVPGGPKQPTAACVSRTGMEFEVSSIDLLIRHARVVRPGTDTPEPPPPVDIAVTDGRISAVGPGLAVSDAARVVDAEGLLAFPGVVDGHQHWGIYRDLAADTDSESRACAQGGVTTSLTYMRTGQYYLNRGGPYREFVPVALDAMAGRSFVDHALHLAPMTAEHIAEIPSLIEDFGIVSFKIFMFYGGHGLHGRSDDQAAFLMIGRDERY